MNQATLWDVSTPIRSAVLSPCGKYRNSLYRAWESGPSLYWVMLNPSTADGKLDDPTVRKCIGFSRCNGFGSLVIENLVPYRATNPAGLIGKYSLDLLGSRWNADRPFERIPRDARVVVAWGQFPYKHNHIGERMLEVLKILPRPLHCVRQTRGRPWHPLYVPYGPLEVWKP